MSDSILRQVDTLFGAGAVGRLSDGQLLERFLARGEPAEAAFEALVQRHGAMVMSVCQSILGDWHEAQDAFQATFLVLASRARSVRKADALGSWLFGVAARVAARARRLAIRRRIKERLGAAMRTREGGPSEPPTLLPELYEELSKLPEKYRVPIVLCHLEGHACEQAASQLQWPVGTVQSRLARGRGRLKARLIRRGFAPTAAVLAAALEPKAVSAAAMPRALVTSTSQAAMRVAAGQTIGTLASATAAELLQEIHRSTFMTRITFAIMAIVAAGLAASGAAVMAFQKAEPPAAADAKKDVYVKAVNERGEAVAGAEIRPRRIGADDRPFTTDAHGRARIPAGVLVDDSVLLAHSDQHVGWLSYYDKAVRGGARGTEADPLVITLEPLTHRVTGTLVDENGKPIAGVVVHVDSIHNDTNGAVWLRNGPPGNLESWPGSKSTTDETGHYTLTLPARANGSLSALHPRYVGPSIGFKEQTSELESTTLEAAGGIAGTVTDAATGKPVAGAMVGAQLLDHRERILGGGWSDAVSDAHGRFLIGGLQPGVYNVLFTPFGSNGHYTAAAVEAVRVEAGKDATADVRRIEGRRIHGTVTDLATHQPLRGVHMGYYGTARPRSGAAIMGTRTDDQGRFEFFVPPGPAFVYVAQMEYSMRGGSQTLVVPADRDPEPVYLKTMARSDGPQVAYAPVKATTVRIREEAKQEPALHRTLKGRVLDPEGKPLPGASVSVTGPKFIMAAADRDGVFDLKGLPEGELDLSIRKTDYGDKMEHISADQKEVQIELPRNQVLSVRKRAAKPAEPRDPNVAFVDLQPYGTDALVDGPGGRSNDLTSLPMGEQKLADLWFDVGEFMVHVQGETEADMPEKVEGIKVNSEVKTMHILHATQQAVPNGTEIGAYIINYKDGSSERIPIVYGKDLCNWWDFGMNEFPSGAVIAWQGKNREGANAQQVRLFARTWENPHPERVVETIDVESKNTACDPFVVAITIEKK